MNIEQLQATIDDQNAAINILTKEVEDYENVLMYAANKPGLAEMLEVARLYPGKVTGMANLWELVEFCGADLSDESYKAVNNGMRIVYGTLCHELPEEHDVYLEDGTKVSSVLYPMDMLPVLRSMLKYGGFI